MHINPVMMVRSENYFCHLKIHFLCNEHKTYFKNARMKRTALFKYNRTVELYKK